MADTLNVYPPDLEIGDALMIDGFVVDGATTFRNETRVWGRNHDGSNGYRDFRLMLRVAVRRVLSE